MAVAINRPRCASTEIPSPYLGVSDNSICILLNRLYAINCLSSKVLAVAVLFSTMLLYAQAPKRKALIIGNARYSRLTKLQPAAVNDANGVAHALQRSGFDPLDITVKFNLDVTELRAAVSDFARTTAAFRFVPDGQVRSHAFAAGGGRKDCGRSGVRHSFV
jgi:hypothetical protein